MKNKAVTSALLAVCISFTGVPVASAQDHDSAPGYAALEGVVSSKTVFDIRTVNPKYASLQLKLIRQTHQELAAMKQSPVTTVVFIGQSVKLVSKSREGFTPDDQKFLDEIVESVSALSKEGIGMELCLVAARVNNVDPATILPEITQVENGYVSVIGYQAKGYSLVPVY